METNISIINCNIRMADNILLNGDLYLPDSKDKLPVIVMRTPYGKHNINAVFDPLMIARRGFGLLVQNVRGRYESSGTFEPFENEKEDGTATVNWLINQTWCNGHVYALGVSYEGFTSIMIGLNSHTKAIAPIMSSSNIYRDWFFENNYIKQGFVQSWSHSFAFTDNGNLLAPEMIDKVQRLASNIKSLYYGKISSFPVNQCLSYYKSWINANDVGYWEKIINNTKGNNQSAIYFVSGWYDIFCEGTLKQYFEQRQLDKYPVRLVIGPWSHTELFGSVVGDVDFGVYSFEKYSSADIIDWFAAIEDGEKIESYIKAYIMGKNRWYIFENLPEPTIKKYYFCKDGQLRQLTQDYWNCSDDIDSFSFDGSNPVPTCGGRCIDAIPEGLGGPKKQELIEKRNDVLVYTSNEMSEELTILGEVFISLSCSSSLEKMDYMIKLCDVNQNDVSINILDSGYRVDEKADSRRNYCFSIGTVGHTFMPGHRIRCEISSTNFPRLNIQEWLLDKQGINSVFLNQSTAIILPTIELND